jgi:tetratricopeptide (TPR) repeat protein
MKKRTYTEKHTPMRDKSLEDLIYDALIEEGWLLPQTEEDILRVERALARIKCAPLPPELSDPYRFIGHPDEAPAVAEMDTDSYQSPSCGRSQVLTEKGAPENFAYVYVSDELLDDEPTTDEVKRLIIEVRHQTRQRRYQEALELARQATEIDPHYWRAWTSYGSLLALLGNLDEGEAIFHRVKKDFSDNPKAVAAALHNCAFAKEVTCEFDPSEENFQEILHEYEDALSLDDSRTNTRASLFINSAMSCQPDKGRSLIEDFVECEDFVSDMALETEERQARGVKTYKFLQVLSMPFRNRLYDAGLMHGPA